jgi:hypothetical protein
MNALSGFLVLATFGLVIMAIAQVRHHDLLTGAKLILWAFVPLAVLLLGVWPTQCRVKTRRGLACRRDAYGFLFGCDRFGHGRAKFYARLHWENGAERSIEPPTGNYAVMHQPAPGSEPVRVKIEDSGRTICAFWIGVAGLALAVVQTIMTLALH